MIAAQDLMIGDWVMVAECVADAHFTDYPDKIESIRDGLVGLESDGLETIIERIAPIPLTAQILEKNGFKNPTLNDPELINYVFKASFEHKSPLPNVEVLRVNYYDGVEWDFYALLGERESSDCGEQYEYVIIIKYVHELQHALRLAGIDITIEL